MNSYYTSTGKRYTTAQLDKKITLAKKEFHLQEVQGGGWVCDKCGEKPHNSHIIGVKDAKENSLSELCYNIANLEKLCAKHHTEFELKSEFERKIYFLNKLIENENFTMYNYYIQHPYFFGCE